MSRSNKIADLIDNNGDIKSTHLDNISVTPTAVSDQANTSTGYLDLPSGTTAQRPTLGDNAGGTRFNTTTSSLEFYDGANWVSTNLIPTINSITGTIYTVSNTLTLSLTNATDTIDVKYYESGTLLATDTGITVTNGSATSTVPSQVYGKTVGDTISIQVFNSDGTPSSNSITKTVMEVPTGGTNANGTSRAVVTSGGYRYHAFLSSGNFVVPTGWSTAVEYLIVAGGGAGGGNQGGGGGGAGGVLTGTTTPSVQTHSIQVGGGGVAATVAESISTARKGEDSTALGLTANGGGCGSQTHGNFDSNSDGGSGGGGTGRQSSSGGDGTLNQGNDGGDAVAGNTSNDIDAGGGGGGYSAAGQTAPAAHHAGDGGDGINMSAWATATSTGDSGYYAGGGGGGTETTNVTNGNGTGGAGGGGNGSHGSSSPQNGTANTGGGGGGYGAVGWASGGSGIVIIRYQLS